MSAIEDVVSAEQDGQTLAAVVRAITGGLPWSRARSLVWSGRVQCDDQIVTDPSGRVRVGQAIRIVEHAPRPQAATTIELLHVDPDVVVVDKPAGISSVPFDKTERNTLLHRAHSTLRRHEGGRHLPPLRVVQRLDKFTSGVVVFARTRRAERGLAEQFRRHEVDRLYLALAYGPVREGVHDTWLVADRGDRRRGSWTSRGSASRPPSARRAITHVRVRQYFAASDLAWTESTGGVPGISWVMCRLQTGRQHQIRIHLAEQGHPLVGEWVYDNGGAPRLQEFVDRRGRPMLHAASLGFQHPTRDTSMAFSSEVPADFASLLGRLDPESVT